MLFVIKLGFRQTKHFVLESKHVQTKWCKAIDDTCNDDESTDHENVHLSIEPHNQVASIRITPSSPGIFDYCTIVSCLKSNDFFIYDKTPL